ncbi:MAG: c-type cytochrome [Acidobacteria bacterium]|nr:c-type cytochrome [Acidobacteriota bacterium]
MVASITTTIAWIVLIVVTLGWAVYGLASIRQGRREAGAEIRLAANRKPYYDDDELEGRKLERTQLLGVAFLAVITIVLPLYWILEPGRQSGAEKMWEHQFEGWGGRLFASTADGGYNCAGCHGGMNGAGGAAAYSVADPTTGEVKAVDWKAPAVNTIFYRFSESEVRFILQYGRPFSPMSPWGLEGGGPLNSQQLQTLLDYMHSIQVPREDCAVQGADARSCEGGHLPKEMQDAIQAEAERLVEAGTYATVGEALFNLDLAGGGYSCARCHTKGWSYGEPQITGGGAFGPNLTGGSAVRQFPNQSDMIAFIKGGSEYGKRYGAQGQGSGRMPAFGAMLTDEQITAIVEYVRGL